MSGSLTVKSVTSMLQSIEVTCMQVEGGMTGQTGLQISPSGSSHVQVQLQDAVKVRECLSNRWTLKDRTTIYAMPLVDIRRQFLRLTK